MRENYCYYVSNEREKMIPVKRYDAKALLSIMTDKKVMSYDSGKEIQGKLLEAPYDIFVMPLSDY